MDSLESGTPTNQASMERPLKSKLHISKNGESTQRRNEKCFAYYFGVYLERVARERGEGDSEPIKNLKPQFFIFSKQLQYWIVLVTGVIYHVATYENTILSRKNM